MCFSVSASVKATNSAIDLDDPEALAQALSNSDAGLHSYTPDCVPSYLENLKQLKLFKAESGN